MPSNPPCHWDAICTNYPDGSGYSCSCPTGWVGDGNSLKPPYLGTGCTVLLKCPVGSYGIFGSCSPMPQHGECYPSQGLNINITRRSVFHGR